MTGLFFGCLLLGLVVGIVVTELIHRGHGWPEGTWQQRYGDTRLRLGNLPVGGVFLLVVSLPQIVDWSETGAACLGASIGMTVAAVGWGLRYPLDPA